jgi:hypothetical protein
LDSAEDEVDRETGNEVERKPGPLYGTKKDLSAICFSMHSVRSFAGSLTLEIEKDHHQGSAIGSLELADREVGNEVEKKPGPLYE